MSSTFPIDSGFLNDVYGLPQYISVQRTLKPVGMEVDFAAVTVDADTLATVKTFLHVTHTTDDDLITGFIASATRDIESFTGILLSQRAVTVFWKRIYNYAQLPYPPHVSVTSVTSILDDGTQTSLTKGVDYYLLGNKIYFLEFLGSAFSQLKVVYLAGYGTNATDIPQSLRDAVTEQTQLYYKPENRNLVVDQNCGLIFQAKALASRYIYYYEG